MFESGARKVKPPETGPLLPAPQRLARQKKAKLRTTEFYIGLENDGQPSDFVTFRPKKSQLTLELKLPLADDLDTKIDDAGLDTLEYNKFWRYRLRLTQELAVSSLGLSRSTASACDSGQCCSESIRNLASGCPLANAATRTSLRLLHHSETEQ